MTLRERFFYCFRKKICALLGLPIIFGLAACTIEDLPELEVQSVSIYAEPDANQNSALAVDMVLVYDQELLKIIGQMSATKYFASVRQLLLDNPSLLDIWHWELVPGQIVSDFTPNQDKGDAYGGYIFANYYTAGDHRVKIAPSGIVKILLLRDDLRNLVKFNSRDVNMGTTMSDISNQCLSDCDEDCAPSGCGVKLGPTQNPFQSCQRRAPASLCMPSGMPCSPCGRARRQVQILTRPLVPIPMDAPDPDDSSR